MAEIHYLISDASKKVDVEAHVLRYWEEELELSIPRNEMGHRFYTDYHIRLFRQVKSLKEKGYQLKAIKAALAKTFQDGKTVISGEILEEDVIAALKGSGSEGQETQEKGKAGTKEGAGSGQAREKEAEDAPAKNLAPFDRDSVEALLAEEKMEQFQKLMDHIIGRAMEENTEKLSQDVSYLVHDKLMKEMEYLMRVSDEREEERFKQLDEAIRSCQRDNLGRAEAAASAFPFFHFKKKKFGRNGNKL
ncbi:MerR family transcriptional regulator [Clostridiaceae bacterium]|jgi:DNA-binding transcriptional MerR regulator|nr:MerR family transcriptional regulator [Clostridium sp.]NBI71738.1 MerR family transcriptional regulator [Clostridiaceae bacterium]